MELDNARYLYFLSCLSRFVFFSFSDLLFGRRALHFVHDDMNLNFVDSTRLPIWFSGVLVS